VVFLKVAILCKTHASFISSTDGIAGVNHARKLIIFFTYFVILCKQMLCDNPIISQRVLPDL